MARSASVSNKSLKKSHLKDNKGGYLGCSAVFPSILFRICTYFQYYFFSPCDKAGEVVISKRALFTRSQYSRYTLVACQWPMGLENGVGVGQEGKKTQRGSRKIYCYCFFVWSGGGDGGKLLTLQKTSFTTTQG